MNIISKIETYNGQPLIRANKMKKIIHQLKVFSVAVTLPLAMFTAPLSHSAPGNLADTPLFLANPIQPNIAFMFDDSGSMGWEQLLNAGTFMEGGVAFGTGGGDSNLFHPPASILNATTNTDFLVLSRRLTCRGFNIMAYDPILEYTPWAGNDSADVPYANQTLASARFNPYLTGAANNRNIDQHIFFRWNDNGNGRYDGPDSENRFALPDAATDECGDVSDDANGVAVDSLPATRSPTDPNSQQNYANWYTYYRDREFVAKRALSQVMFESNARMGLGRINNLNDANSTPVRDVDDISLPIDTTAQANKTALLNDLFRFGSAGGTPLRTGLDRAGRYFEGENTNWGPTPILSNALGGECQQNFTILMSDGFWNGPDPQNIGDTDIDGTGIFDGGSYADDDTENTVADTLADVAMHFYERDLSTTLPDRVIRTDSDPDSANLTNGFMHQHMKTFTVAFGLTGSVTANPMLNGTAPFAWPTPTANNLTTVDDMRHAAYNGRGEFLSAGNPQQLIDGIRSAVSAISASRGSSAAVSFNTSALDTNTDVYLSLLNSENWDGDLLAFPIDPNTGNIGNTPRWSAATELTNRNLILNPRTILSYNGTDGIPFQWANLTPDQQNDLRTNADLSQSNIALGRARLEYLRGSRTCEENSSGTCSVTESPTDIHNTKILRERGSRLGDIINSAPTFVGEPTQIWPDNLHDSLPTPPTPHSLFRIAQASRAGVIYTGANDGMLHGFAENNGEEIMAYVPSYLASTNTSEGLHYLSDPAYAHRFYVDLTPTVSDAFVRTTTTGTASWETILVGGSGAGGRGLFALDITNPSFSESAGGPANTVLWEFSDADDVDLGFTLSNPSIVPLNNGRWAAIFGNGYNDFGGSGEAQLFIAYIDGGLDGTWTLNTDYIKISTNVGTPGARNGLSSPAVIDSDNDGTADRVYAGDLEGNMWVFDLSDTDQANWEVAYSAGDNPRALFSTPANQPITTTPTIVRNTEAITTSITEPNTLVLFGTGQYLVDGDQSTAAPQTFYGIWDTGTSTGGGASSNRILTIDDLVQQTIGNGATSGGVLGRTLTDNNVNYSIGGDNGWFINLPAIGERAVTDAVVRGNLVFFNTIIPDSDPCSAGGSSFLMIAQIANGGSPNEPVFDINNDGRIDNLDAIGNLGAAGESLEGIASRSSILSNTRYTGTTESGSSQNLINGSNIDQTAIIPLTDPNEGRLSWEEITQ